MTTADESPKGHLQTIELIFTEYSFIKFIIVFFNRKSGFYYILFVLIVAFSFYIKGVTCILIF